MPSVVAICTNKRDIGKQHGHATTWSLCYEEINTNRKRRCAASHLGAIRSGHSVIFAVGGQIVMGIFLLFESNLEGKLIEVMNENISLSEILNNPKGCLKSAPFRATSEFHSRTSKAEEGMPEAFAAIHVVLFMEQSYGRPSLVQKGTAYSSSVNPILSRHWITLTCN